MDPHGRLVTGKYPRFPMICGWSLHVMLSTHINLFLCASIANMSRFLPIFLPFALSPRRFRILFARTTFSSPFFSDFLRNSTQCETPTSSHSPMVTRDAIRQHTTHSLSLRIERRCVTSNHATWDTHSTGSFVAASGRKNATANSNTGKWFTRHREAPYRNQQKRDEKNGAIDAFVYFDTHFLFFSRISFIFFITFSRVGSMWGWNPWTKNALCI